MSLRLRLSTYDVHPSAHAAVMQNFSRKGFFSEAKCAEATRSLRINDDGLKLLPPWPASHVAPRRTRAPGDRLRKLL